MTSIAFIGLGNMGGPMAANLVKAGHKVVAFDLVDASRNQAKTDGATIANSAAASVKGADVVITMLPAGKTRRAPRPSQFWKTWARRSCIAAAPALGRRRKSATT